MLFDCPQSDGIMQTIIIIEKYKEQLEWSANKEFDWTKAAYKRRLAFNICHYGADKFIANRHIAHAQSLWITHYRTWWSEIKKVRIYWIQSYRFRPIIIFSLKTVKQGRRIKRKRVNRVNHAHVLLQQQKGALFAKQWTKKMTSTISMITRQDNILQRHFVWWCNT